MSSLMNRLRKMSQWRADPHNCMVPWCKGSRTRPPCCRKHWRMLTKKSQKRAKKAWKAGFEYEDWERVMKEIENHG